MGMKTGMGSKRCLYIYLYPGKREMSNLEHGGSLGADFLRHIRVAITIRIPRNRTAGIGPRTITRTQCLAFQNCLLDDTYRKYKRKTASLDARIVVVIQKAGMHGNDSDHPNHEDRSQKTQVSKETIDWELKSEPRLK